MPKVFWFSWEQHSKDNRPLNYPPKEQVLGYWCSGSDHDGKYWTMIAAVKAESKDECIKIITSDWEENVGEIGKIRFCDKMTPNENGQYEVGDRFHTSEWMNERGIINK